MTSTLVLFCDRSAGSREPSVIHDRSGGTSCTYHRYASRDIDWQLLDGDSKTPRIDAAQHALEGAGGGLIAMVSESSTGRTAGLRFVSGEAYQPPTEGLRLRAGTPPEFFELDQQDHPLAHDERWVIPADQELQTTLRQFVEHLEKLPGDYATLFLNLLRRPGLEVGMHRLERAMRDLEQRLVDLEGQRVDSGDVPVMSDTTDQSQSRTVLHATETGRTGPETAGGMAVEPPVTPSVAGIAEAVEPRGGAEPTSRARPSATPRVLLGLLALLLALVLLNTAAVAYLGYRSWTEQAETPPADNEPIGGATQAAPKLPSTAQPPEAAAAASNGTLPEQESGPGSQNTTPDALDANAEDGSSELDSGETSEPDERDGEVENDGSQHTAPVSQVDSHNGADGESTVLGEETAQSQNAEVGSTTDPSTDAVETSNAEEVKAREAEFLTNWAQAPEDSKLRNLYDNHIGETGQNWRDNKAAGEHLVYAFAKLIAHQRSSDGSGQSKLKSRSYTDPAWRSDVKNVLDELRTDQIQAQDWQLLAYLSCDVFGTSNSGSPRIPPHPKDKYTTYF